MINVNGEFGEVELEQSLCRDRFTAQTNNAGRGELEIRFHFVLWRNEYFKYLRIRYSDPSKEIQIGFERFLSIFQETLTLFKVYFVLLV